MKKEINDLYELIIAKLANLILENWKEIYLYVSFFENKKGELYFYYYPKKIIKTKPINCYEIPEKFGIDEKAFNKKLTELYSILEELNNNYIIPRCTNATIQLTNDIFKIKFSYEDLVNSKYTDTQRRIMWAYKYLNIPIESMSISERSLIETYKENTIINPMIYTEHINVKIIENSVKTLEILKDKEAKEEIKNNEMKLNTNNNINDIGNIIVK